MLDTASFWFSAAGLTLAARGHREAGGWLLLLVSLGYVGVMWERSTGARLSSVKHLQRQHFSARQVLAHSTVGYFGWRLLRR